MVKFLATNGLKVSANWFCMYLLYMYVEEKGICNMKHFSISFGRLYCKFKTTGHKKLNGISEQGYTNSVCHYDLSFSRHFFVNLVTALVSNS